MAVKAPVSPPKEVIEEVPEELEGIELDQVGDFKPVSSLEPFPPFPGKFIKREKANLFWKWLDSLKPEHYNVLNFYLYREHPVIDRKRVKPDAFKYIDCYGHKFTEDTIKLGDEGTDHPKHGSGRYQIKINDSSKSTTGYKGKGIGQIGEVQFEINDSEHPPVFRLDELVTDHPSNKSLVDSLIAQGKLTPEGKPMTPNGGNGDNTQLIGLLREVIANNRQQAQPSKDATSEALSKMYLEANSAAMSMLKDQIKSDDPEKLVKLLGTFKDMLPKDSGNNDLMMMLMKMSMESSSKFELLLMKLLDKPKEEDSFDKELERMLKMKELMGDNGGGGKKTTLETVMEYGAPVAEKLLGTIGALIQFATTRKAAGSPATVTPEQLAQIEQKPPQTNPETMQAPVEQPASNVVEMPKAPTLRELIAGPVGPMIIDALKAGKTGDMFAESVATMFNELTYQQISGLGKEAIINEMQAVPAFYAQVVPSAIEKFVEDFIAYGTDTEVEGGE